MCLYVGISTFCAGTLGGWRYRITLELALQTFVNHLTWVLGIKFRSLEKQYVILTTRPSLQPQEI